MSILSKKTENKPIPMVSIVIPVYNTENYLRQCMDSVVGQTFQDIEILCVDDGSTDQSKTILEEYAAKDPRVHVFSRKKGRVGAVRNFGLKKSSGKYVIFWDSDDWFELHAIESMVNQAEEMDADLCICNVWDFDDETGQVLAHNYLRKPYPETEPFSIQDCPDRIFQITSSNCWNRLVRKDLLDENKIRFPEGDCLEDEVYSMLLLACAKRITLCKKRLIHYRVDRLDSIMFNFDKKPDLAAKGYQECYKQMNKRGFLKDETICRSFLDRICGLYLYQLSSYRDFDTFKEHFQKTIKNDPLFEKLWNPSWEIDGQFLPYLTAKEEEPGNYLLRRVKELNKTRLVQNAKIDKFKAKEKKNNTKIKELEEQILTLKKELESLKNPKKDAE